MRIIPVSKNIFDVFTGEGWDQHVRVKTQGAGKRPAIISKVSHKIPAGFWKDLQTELAKFPGK